MLSDKEIFDKLYQSSLHFLSYRPRSEHEIRDFIKRKLRNNDTDPTEKIISQLKEEKLVNDEEFVQWWIDQRLEFNPKGLRFLKQELFIKGIDREIIENGLSKINKSALESSAVKILEKKSGKYRVLPEKLFKEKLISLLLARGFDWNFSKNIVDEFSQKRYNRG
jgi:regulatory protein